MSAPVPAPRTTRFTSRAALLAVVICAIALSLAYPVREYMAQRLQIDQLIAKLTQDPKNVFIEIEGHTDNVGSADYNEKLGLERAEAAKRYLYEKHQIPLHKINVFSYGEEKPVAPNNTKEGRAENRRVVIRVLS